MRGVGLDVGFGVGWPPGFIRHLSVGDRHTMRIATAKLSTFAVHSGGVA